MSAPLEGVRVVELASFVAAPAAGALLADLGAEVVKVEVPNGEVYRYSMPKVFGMANDFPEAPPFQMDNRGKRSIALDIERPPARAALARLVERADVLLTNMLPRRLERYGFGPAALQARHPRLVIARLSGYGAEGPEADTPAFDYAAYWARTGFMDMMREPDAPPAFQRAGIGDHAAALALVSGVLAALRVRDRDGHGQVVDVSLQHIGYYVNGYDTSMALVVRDTPPRHDRRRPFNPLWNQYPTRDGRWLFLVMIDSNRYWQPFCAAIERPDLLEDARFSGFLERIVHAADLATILAETFSTRTLAEWEEHLRGAPIIWAPVRTVGEAIHDEQARAAGVFQAVDHPSAGRFETVAPPVRLSRHPMRGDRAAPALGADAESVLREAGLGDEEIAAALARER
jgi:crotonobetainyl-CoA:carnitine CoA-transferase CaiB-like acyl-CoA transferase